MYLMIVHYVEFNSLSFQIAVENYVKLSNNIIIQFICLIVARLMIKCNCTTEWPLVGFSNQKVKNKFIADLDLPLEISQSIEFAYFGSELVGDTPRS